MNQLALESESTDGLDSIDLYVCNYCTELFSSENTLKAHQMNHQILVGNDCDSCKTKFKSRYELRYHNCIKKFIYSVCGDTLPSLQKKEKHELDHHHKEHGHLCEECGNNFQDKINLKQHIKTEHSESIKEFTCTKCPRKFKYKTRLDHHVRSSHSTKEHICQDCNFHFKNAVVLKHHVIHEHSGINAKVRCSEFNARVPVHSLRKHMDTHKVLEIKVSVMCDSCLELLSTQELMENHKKVSYTV
ncbi:hypothetical protein QAD02_005791 [Eretmocerus hayati]|uniref:Uncharacterized protein n=1 Tax=Eretmocerus hayati TaxID=131215 RepID=A0ACC2NTF3_9HYME|nr:hypothetical protein QAD02_005791 [Eretmocerus hayati]